MEARPILRSKVLSIRTRIKMLEAFVKSFLLCGLSTVAYHKMNVSRLNAVKKTAWTMMLGLHSRRRINFKFPAEKISLRNLAAQLQ